MAETQRETVPRIDTGELDTALAFLAFARGCVVKKTVGLSEEQLRRVLVPTGTSLLGLVQHLTDSERYWFGYHLAGRAEEFEGDFEMVVPEGRTAEEVLVDYAEAILDSDEAILRAGDMDAPVGNLVDGEQLSLRWVVTHMSGETTRHAGHADILRELIDGTTGR